ncbi:MAG: pyridoxine 5'-phosphate synthase [Rhodanobacteraceae bacterium]
MIRLSINVNKVAALRNARGGNAPDPVEAARIAIRAGCGGITVHPRPDQRHIRVDDVARIADVVTAVEYNVEGNPFAPARDSYPGYIELIRRVRPTQATLVPDSDNQITSDHGFDPQRDADRLQPVIAELKSLECRVSLFVDAGIKVAAVRELGADCIEIYTGPYASAFESGDYARELEGCAITAREAQAAGLAVNAGHDLNQRNLAALKRAIPFLAEVSIGHALIGEALYDGLAPTVRNYLAILSGSDVE